MHHPDDFARAAAEAFHQARVAQDDSDNLFDGDLSFVLCVGKKGRDEIAHRATRYFNAGGNPDDITQLVLSSFGLESQGLKLI